MKKIECFACGKPMENVFGPVEPGDRFQADDGVHFYSTGNYGSTVLDSIDGSDRVEILICDGCLIDPVRSQRVTATRRGEDTEIEWPPEFEKEV